jgi:hypothetical protein
LCEFLKISGHCVFDELIRRPARLRGKLMNARLGFWSKVQFHE